MSWLSSLKNKVKKLQWKDVGKVAKTAAPVLAMTGIGTPFAAGIGALGGLMSGKKGGGLSGALTGALGGLAGGAAKWGLGKLGGLGSLFGGQAAQAATGGGPGGVAGLYGPGNAEQGQAYPQSRGGGSWLDSVKNFLVGGGGNGQSGLAGLLGNKNLQSLAGLGLGAYGVYDQSQQRKSSEKFNQKRLDTLMEVMGRAEDAYDEKAPLREGGQSAMLDAMAQLGSMESPYASFMKDRKSGKRKAGEFTSSTAGA